jgi:cyclopropane fatty-acyl-phospholipid synthase-like methyltransferase
MVIEMEIRQVIERLADGDRVLDVGCANGYSTVQYAAQRRVSVRGTDYVPAMVDQASRQPDTQGRRTSPLFLARQESRFVSLAQRVRDLPK